jgi:large subunit ribosomal protein L13
LFIKYLPTQKKSYSFAALFRDSVNKTVNKVDTLSYKTVSANKATANKKWVIVDAENQVVGRLSSKVAKILRGKYKPSFTPHADCGDNVIIINAEKVVFTGNKMDDKVYTRHTGYPGGQRFATPTEVMRKYPERILENAIKGMLPKNRLGRAILGNLYVYVGTEHKHSGQQPEFINLDNLK